MPSRTLGIHIKRMAGSSSKAEVHTTAVVPMVDDSANRDMMNPIPAINPLSTGYGKNRTIRPSRNHPSTKNVTPVSNVQRPMAATTVGSGLPPGVAAAAIAPVTIVIMTMASDCTLAIR